MAERKLILLIGAICKNNTQTSNKINAPEEWE